MLYSTFIAQLRTQVGDTKRRIHVDFIGDGSTTIFQLPIDTFPILENTYTVKVAGSTIAETTNYTLDKETGTLVIISAPTNGQAVTIDASAVYLLDATWLGILNDVISSLGDDFWKEFVDTAHVTTANMISLSLVALQPKCIAVYEFFYRGSASEDWSAVENYTNWRYDRDNNVLYLGARDAFTQANQALKIRGLKTFTQGSVVSDTIDVQDRYLTILEYGSIARYWRYRYKSVIELVSKMTTEQTRTPLQELIMLSDRFDRAYEVEKGKLKPMKPARIVPISLNNGGRP